MKKTVAILFLSIHLFGLTGKFLFVEYFIHQNDVSIVNQIDIGNYNVAQLIEIKIPLNLPYYSSSLKYERYYGDIDFDGKYYNYVMRKVLNDTVYLLCLPNQSKAELNKAKLECASNVADINNTSPLKKGNLPAVKKNILTTEYFQQNIQFHLHNLSISDVEKEGVIFSSRLNQGKFVSPFQPPENKLS